MLRAARECCVAESAAWQDGFSRMALRIVSREDLSLMPKGDKIAKLLRIR